MSDNEDASRTTALTLFPLGVHSDFLLVRLGDARAWSNFKLTNVRATGQQKRSWYFGWNGERLCRNKDVEHLAHHYPETHRWLIKRLTYKR
jgi:hypothetical protein